MLFEKFTTPQEEIDSLKKEVSKLKKELKRAKYTKHLVNKIVSVDDLSEYGIPEEIQKEMAKWEIINKSPYSDTFYSSTDVDWGHKPDKSYRVSDHWNFYTNDKWHCQTDKKVPNNTHISLGQYDKESGKYKILLTLPTNKQIERQAKEEVKLKYLKDPETIYKKKQFKDRITNKEVFVKLNYDSKDYQGIVKKYTGSELKIENDKGEQIFSENYMDSSKTKQLDFFDKDGNKIENPIEYTGKGK